MARLGIRTVVVRSSDKKKTIKFDFVVNVNSEGLFTTTLDQADVNILKSYGINLGTNGRSGAREGFFKSSTLDKLIISVKEVAEKCLSEKLISKDIVIKYVICSVASFGFTKDDKIIPNLGFHADGIPDKDRHWQKGTVDSHASNPLPVGLQLFVDVKYKCTYEYLDGRKRIAYERISDIPKSDQQDLYYLHWLNNICSQKRPQEGKLIEMPYTEDRAKFFVDLYKGLCKLAYMAKQFEQPESIDTMIEQGRGLLLEP